VVQPSSHSVRSEREVEIEGGSGAAGHDDSLVGRAMLTARVPATARFEAYCGQSQDRRRGQRSEPRTTSRDAQVRGRTRLRNGA